MFDETPDGVGPVDSADSVANEEGSLLLGVGPGLTNPDARFVGIAYYHAPDADGYRYVGPCGDMGFLPDSLLDREVSLDEIDAWLIAVDE